MLVCDQFAGSICREERGERKRDHMFCWMVDDGNIEHLIDLMCLVGFVYVFVCRIEHMVS